MSGRIRERVGKLEGKHPPDMTAVILEELPDGRYRRPGDGRIFTAAELARFGDAALTFQTRLVRPIGILPAIDGEV